MKNAVSAMFVACAVSVSVGLAAQGEPATQSQEPAAQAPRPTAPREPSAAAPRSAQEKVTISGCIESAPTAVGGAAASAAAGPKFMLSNAKMGDAAARSAVGTSGTAAAATRYRLDGEEKTISPHLNHQVEITGTVQTSSASATGEANAAPGSAAAGPVLKVDSLKMVSATCQK